MNPNSSAEQPPGKSMQEQARATADQIIANMIENHQNAVAEISLIKNDSERLKALALLEQKEVSEFRSKLNEQIREASDTGQAVTPEDKKTKAEKAKHIFLEAKALDEVGVKVGNAGSQQAFNKIVEYIKNGQISDEGALVLERNIGKDLLNGIVFSKKGEPSSNFEKNLRIAFEADPVATTPLLRDLRENQDIYGYEGTPQDLLSRIDQTIENDQQKSQNTLNQNVGEDEENEERLKAILNETDPAIINELSQSSYIGELKQYYLSRFTQDQIDLIKSFYSPTAFVRYIERLNNGDKNGDGKFILTPDKVQERRQEIERNIKEYYEKNNKSFKPGEDLQTLVERRWAEEVSKNMEWNISDVINQLFLELQEKSPNKFYDQIMQEDIFQGPSQIQHRIQSAINNLMTKMEQIEGGNSELAMRIKKLNLYEQQIADSYIEERGSEKDGENKKIYPRIHPFTHGEKIEVTDFIRHVYHTIDQTISKAEYFHNSRAIYGHPPGEKGFYQQLGDFAEQMKGGGIDEILMLPDGQHILEAYQLYEKMLQEDFAQLDQRHRPDQLSNKLERVNSQIELEVFKQLKDFYPELSDERLRNIVNSGVGISRGIFLTESEKSAYADPIDSEGKGMIASYSTNDAGSLNVFNPMHTILRWQGEHFMNSMYFMPVEGQPGPWDHRKSMSNAAKYIDSLLVGKGRGTGKDALPEMFIDSMMDLTNVGGPGKRKGWRTKYSLEGHFVYDPDGTINAPGTFKAMEAIGYEAIFNFYTTEQAGEKLMKSTKNTDPDQAKEKKELFRYIFKRYFSENPENFQEAELDNYLSKLQIKGEEKALDQLKTKGQPFKGGSWEEQVAYETYQLFMENTLARYTAARFPTIFLRMDKNRLHDDGISHWEKIRRKFKDWKREDFDKSMKDLTMAEMLLRRQISGKIRENIKLDEKWTLSQFDKIDGLNYRLDESKIRELLSKNKEDKAFKSEKEINDAIEVFRHIKDSFKKDNFLDNEGKKRIQNYTFTFGLEDTDISLMNFRGTGPRMVARAVKDVASAEQVITPWIIEMPRIMNEIAINGKHDFSPLIEYMRKAQKAITEIHDVPSTYEHMYKIAGTIINYFKKDAMAKPLFGLFRLGKMNSMAAEYAGRSTAVWEWDSRDIDRFAVAMESYGLLKNSPYDLHKFKDGKFTGGQPEDRWIKIPGIKKPIKFGKKRHVDYEFNSWKLRKEHGADWKAISWDYINQFLPLAMAFLLWKYIKDAMDEASGKKKQ